MGKKPRRDIMTKAAQENRVHFGAKSQRRNVRMAPSTEVRIVNALMP
jgi:hypothetical protein